MMQELSFLGTEVGLVYANAALAATFSPLIVGVIADKYISLEKLLFGLHIVGAVLLVAMSQTTSFEIFYVINMVYMLCYMPTFSLSNSMSFHHVADVKRDYPRVRVWGTIAWIVAGIVVGLLNIEAVSTPFLIAAACSVVHAFYCLTLPDTPPAPDRGSSFLKDLQSPEMRELFRDRGFRAIIISLVLISIPAAYYYSFVNPFLHEVGVENAAAKMSIGQITEIGMMLALPWFIRVWSLRWIITIGLFLWGARYGLFTLGMKLDQEWIHIVAIATHGVAYIFGMLTAQIYIDIKVPTYLRSTAQGFFSFLTMGLMAFIATYIAGETVSFNTFADGSHDWAAIWTLPFYCGIATSVFFLAYFRRST